MNNEHPDDEMLDKLQRAIDARNTHEISRIVDVLRYRHRMSYSSCFSVANELTGISLPDWDELLCEADSYPQF